jgi:hypothetical protein
MSKFASLLPEERRDEEQLECDCEEAAVLQELVASSAFGISADDTSTLPAKMM